MDFMKLTQGNPGATAFVIEAIRKPGDLRNYAEAALLRMLYAGITGPAPENKPLIIPFPDPEKAGLCPEVMDVLRENFETCSKLAESYARQASDYAHLLKRYGVDIPEAQKKKAEEIRRIFRR